MTPTSQGGPVAGVRVLELGGIGPGSFAGMLLSQLGADVIRIVRADGPDPDPLGKGRPALALDLKKPSDRDVVLDLAIRADALIDPFRPGVAERLGIGPDSCLSANARLVYVRVTGWGQQGPLAAAAGHDIDYIALTGALHAIGRADGGPVPPLNLLADYGGGGMLAVVGLVSGLLEARSSGSGQVVDAAMIDGVNLLMTLFHRLSAEGLWTDRRGRNRLDGGAPYYDVFETADGRYMAVGALEDKFFAELIERLGVAEEDVVGRDDPACWPGVREHLAAAFRSRSRDAWAAVFEGTDACVAPVLTLAEAPLHEHHRARGSFVNVAGSFQPAPAPRFSRTPASLGPDDKDVSAALARWQGAA